MIRQIGGIGVIDAPSQNAIFKKAEIIKLWSDTYIFFKMIFILMQRESPKKATNFGFL